MVHNVKLLDDCAVVGTLAVVSDWTEVGEWAVIGEGAVVPQGAVVPSGRIAVGVPARSIARPVDAAFRAAWRDFKQTYVDLYLRYAEGYGGETDA